jgi:hypothetical protein
MAGHRAGWGKLATFTSRIGVSCLGVIGEYREIKKLRSLHVSSCDEETRGNATANFGRDVRTKRNGPSIYS